MSKVAFPVAGYNSNVRHRGAEFHLQTEDSGIKSPRIVTHLFADGGRILRTLRTDYREHLDREDLHEFVREQMRAQHKAMYVSLRGGELDGLIEEACGPLSLPPSRLAASQLTLPPELASLPARSLTPTRRSALKPASDERSVVHELAVPEIVKQRPSSPPTRRISGEVPRVERPPQMRPAARSATLPIPQFQSGDAISNQSLDDVILSCLADELKAPK